MSLALLMFAISALPSTVLDDAKTKPQCDIKCTADEYGYCSDKRLSVELTSEKKELHIPLNTALGDVLVIWLPNGVTIPKCRREGSEDYAYCLDLGNSGAFQAEVQDVDNGSAKLYKINLRPYLNDAAKAELSKRAATDSRVLADDIVLGEGGNLQLALGSWLVNLDLTIGPAEKAVRQLVFQSKELSAAQDEFVHKCDARDKELRQQLKDGWANLKTKAQEEAAADMTFNVLRGRRCRFSRWTAFRNQLWVQADSVCQLGEYLFVTFRVRNRAGGGDIFRLGEVAVVKAKDGKDAPRLESVSVFGRGDDADRRLGIEDVELGKDDEIIGAVRFNAKEVTSEVTLRILESGGKAREVELQGIGF